MSRSVPELLAELFPPDVEIAGGPQTGLDGELFPEEEALVARAVKKRRREFRAGRLYARAALARVGVGKTPLLSDNRKPVWPPGIIGTLSHADGCCGVVVARRGEIAGLGLDLEVADAVTEGIMPRIMTPDEMDWLATMEPRREWATLFFGAKEAFYKSLADVYDGMVGFHEVRIEVDEETRAFAIRPLTEKVRGLLGSARVSGSYRFHDRWVFAGATLRLSGESAGEQPRDP